ncbi:MAG: hypothetical protein WC894_05315 [Patescibacteria group bacterium]
MSRLLKIVIPIFIVTLIIYLPIFINSSIVLNRGNDLEEFFWPLFYFVKTQVLINHQLPLWNNLWFSGTPLLPDPQSPLFYLPNIIFLFFSIDHSILISFFLHTFMSGIGAYLLAKTGLKFSHKASLVCTFIYITSPKLASYLIAGHVGLINSLTYLPFVILATIKIAEKPKFSWSVLLAGSLAGLFFTHTLIFLIYTVLASLLFLFLNPIKKAWIFFIVGAVITFGLTAITLLPQLEWQSQTSRNLLITDKDTYPKWVSKIELLKYIFLPELELKNLQNIDTEKWIAVGLLPTILSLIGFYYLNRKLKITTILIGIFVFLLIYNNASPVYFFLHDQDWFNLIRVSTRFWMLIIPLIAVLSAYAFEKLSQKTNLFYIFILLAVIESISYSWAYYKKPIEKRATASQEVYQYLASDKDIFRVFCTTRCLSQKESSIYGLELMDGYGTLSQTNFLKRSWQLTQNYWNYYSLAIPPIGIYTLEQIQPKALDLGTYNVKYIISPHVLKDKNFQLVNTIDNFLIYKNKLLVPRVYEIYKPNYIKVFTTTNQKNLIISEVFSAGWKAYLNGNEEVAVQETPNSLMLVDLKENIKFVDFKYEPTSFKIGKTLTVLTIITLFILSFAKCVLLLINKIRCLRK